jgi:hypothetical protein
MAELAWPPPLTAAQPLMKHTGLLTLAVVPHEVAALSGTDGATP